MKPTVGKTVNYMSHGSTDEAHQATERAAIITEVLSWTGSGGEVNITVLNPHGFHWTRSTFSEDRKPGTWCWMPKESS